MKYQEPLLVKVLNGGSYQSVPHGFGGFWECLIGLTKTTLKKILGRTHAILEGLHTIVVEVEVLLNDRPISYASSDVPGP